jgi:hypothetical protein
MKIKRFNENQRFKNKKFHKGIKGENIKNNMNCSQYLERSIERCYAEGGNGMIIEESLTKCADWLDAESYDDVRHAPSNPGYYTEKTQKAFKDFVDIMVDNEIEGNPSNEQREESYEDKIRDIENRSQDTIDTYKDTTPYSGNN